MTQFGRNTLPDYVRSDSSDRNNELTRINPLQRIWNRRWIVLVVAVLCVSATIIYLLKAQTIYQAGARLTVERAGPRIVANDPSEIGGQTQNYLNTQCEVLRSRKILSLVASDPEVADKRMFINHTDNIVGALKLAVLTSVGKRDDIITVSVRSPYREEAAEMANRIVDAYKADLESQKKSSVRQVIEFYSREKRKVEEGLAKARQAKVDFQRKYADLALGSERVSPTLDRLSRLSSALTEVQLEVLNTQAAYESTKAMAADPTRIRQLLDSRQFKSENADLRRQMRELQQRFAAVGKTYLPDFPDVGVMQTAIKQLEEQLQLEEKSVFSAYLAELEARLTTAGNNSAQIQTFLNEAKREAMEQHTRAAEYAVVQAECDGLEKYDADLTMRIRELSPLSDEAMVNVSIIENARWQDAPQVEPDVAGSLYLAIFGGMLVGSMLAIMRDLFDQRLHSVEQIKQLTGLSVLGVIPHIQRGRSLAQRGRHLDHDPLSDVAEGYRTVRTAIYFGSNAGAVRTLLITSPSQGEGKSTLASNLAIAMAQAGNRVLLLDADFRKPILHKIFEIDRGVGIANVLAGRQSLDEAIQHTGVSGLDVLPCGPIPANPSEILNSQTFADVLSDLSDRYDQVLLDSPPVMPVTDARILAANCDATLLVVRADKTARKAATFAREQLANVGARLLGVVVNDVPRRTRLYDYYYSDAQLSRYGYGAKSPQAKALPDPTAT